MRLDGSRVGSIVLGRIDPSCLHAGGRPPGGRSVVALVGFALLRLLFRVVTLLGVIGFAIGLLALDRFLALDRLLAFDRFLALDRFLAPLLAVGEGRGSVPVRLCRTSPARRS
jgi:hypothetical protein